MTTPRIRPFLEPLFWGLLFALAHSQLPLFSGNQNSYCFHAVVNANGGTLANDWFAATRDAFPLFTLLSASLIRISPLLLHAAFYSILGIAGIAFWFIVHQLTPRSGWQGRTLVMATLTLLFSMELNFRTQRFPAPFNSGFWTSGLANQYLLGGTFQPCVFGAFLLVAVALLLKQRPALAVAALLATIAFHFSYTLSAGSLLLATGWHLWRDTRRPRQAVILTLAGASGLTLFAAMQLWRFSPTTPDTFAQAQAILFNIRLPHHANPRVWWNHLAWLKLGLIAVALLLAPLRPLRRMMISCIAISTLAWAAFAITRSPSLGLLFPWRVSVILIPLSLAILIAASVEFFNSLRITRFLVATTAVVFTVACLYAAMCGVRGLITLSSTQTPHWHALGARVQAHLQPGDIVLIAPHMEEARLNTGIPVWVDRKTHPYLDTEVLQWRHRVLSAESWFKGNPDLLKAADPAGHIRWVLVDDIISTMPDIPGLTLVERINSYRLYRWNH